MDRSKRVSGKSNNRNRVQLSQNYVSFRGDESMNSEAKTEVTGKYSGKNFSHSQNRRLRSPKFHYRAAHASEHNGRVT